MVDNEQYIMRYCAYPDTIDSEINFTKSEVQQNFDTTALEQEIMSQCVGKQ
jgi:hypothetical protein